MPYPKLTVGSRGASVLTLKAYLAVNGFPQYRGTTDDRFYRQTALDVEAIQSTFLGPNGFFLRDSGVELGTVDAITWQALEGRFSQSQGLVKPIVDKVTTGPNGPRSTFLSVMAKWRRDGTAERPAGSNEDGGGVISQMQRFHGMRGQPWCNMGVNYAHWLAFKKLPPWGKSARVCDTWNKALDLGLAFPFSGKLSTLCPGDIAVLVHGGLKASGKAPNADGHIWAIAGHDTKLVYGLECNSGNRVRASKRPPGNIMGVIRLWEPYAYTPKKGEFDMGSMEDR